MSERGPPQKARTSREIVRHRRRRRHTPNRARSRSGSGGPSLEDIGGVLPQPYGPQSPPPGARQPQRPSRQVLIVVDGEQVPERIVVERIKLRVRVRTQAQAVQKVSGLSGIHSGAVVAARSKTPA